MTASEYVTEIWCPPAASGVHALHSHMREPEPLPEPLPEPEPAAARDEPDPWAAEYDVEPEAGR